MIPGRRFAAALRAMHWGQILVELTLLVVGILIALAVNSWIDDRREARLERQYLELLARDLDRGSDAPPTRTCSVPATCA